MYGEIRSSVKTSIVRAESLQSDQCKSEQRSAGVGRDHNREVFENI